MDKVSFIKWIYPATKGLEINGIFTTAQAALESGWGTSSIGNNIFGITKGSSWNGAVELVTTTEYFSTDKVSFKLPERVLSIMPFKNKKGVTKYKYKVKRLFRQYDTIVECLKDHESILKKPIYADAWPYRNDPEEFAKKIVDSVGGKYATALDYADNLKSIIRDIRKIIDTTSDTENEK